MTPRRAHDREQEPPLTPDPPAPGSLPPDGVPFAGAERVRVDPALRVRWLAVVLAITAAGAVLVAFGHWELGAGTIGAGMIVGALIRAIIPSPEAGLLRVRRRVVDVAWMLAIGIGIIALVISRM